MDQRSPAAEATLLSSVGQMPDTEVFQQDVTDLLEDYGEVVQTFEKINDVYF